MSKLAFRVHNGCDIIDSRNIIAHVEELESELQDIYDRLVDAQAPFDEWLTLIEKSENHEDFDIADTVAELLMFRALVEDINNNAGDNAEDGVTLIRDSYFEIYAQNLAEDIGAVDRNASWPNNCIDWERAARELQHDYSTVEFDGETYWVRS